PEPVNGPWITVGWLLAGARAGEIPAPSKPPTPRQVTEYRLRLSLEQLSGGAAVGCVPAPKQPTIVDVTPGQSWVVTGTVQVALIGDVVGTSSIQIPFGASFLSGAGPHTLKDVGGPMTLKIWRLTPTATLCGLPLSS